MKECQRCGSEDPPPDYLIVTPGDDGDPIAGEWVCEDCVRPFPTGRFVFVAAWDEDPSRPPDERWHVDLQLVHEPGRQN